MVTATRTNKVSVQSEIKVVHECIFWEEDDPRWMMIGKEERETYLAGDDNALEVDMEEDSYIWVFAGSRGAGKSVSMTYFAMKAVYLYGARLLSNYPIDFILVRVDGTREEHHAEPLDMYKLLCFDSDYSHCLIIIDEAPDIISHMASQSWKNRLLNIFVRQLRKNRNSLFLGAQDFYLIDKSMRWQTDLILECKDAFRKYGRGQGLTRGALCLIDVKDNSGQWTGTPDEWETVGSLELPGKSVWGAFDTHFEQDVWESLKKVDMKMMTYKVGAEDLSKSNYLERTREKVQHIMRTEPDQSMLQPYFYKELKLTPREKRDVSLRLSKAGVVSEKDTGKGKFRFFFWAFNEDKFMGDDE